MSISDVSRLKAPRIGRLLAVGLAVGAATAALNVIVYSVATALGVPFDVQMAPGQPPQALNAVPFILASFVPALVAAGLYGLLGRFTQRATAIFTGAAVVVALLSLFAPLTMPVVLSTRLVLALLHLTTAAIIVYGLTRFARQ